MLRYLALGDSYTIGEGVEPGERWPAVLSGLLRDAGMEVAEPEIVAATGWTTDELSSGIDAAGPAGRYDLVTLLIGVNDQYRGRPLDVYAAGFDALLSRAIDFGHGAARRVVVVSIPDWSVTPYAEGRDRDAIAREIDAFNSVARRAAVARGSAWVDVTEASRAAGAAAAAYVADGLHPAAEAYARWATLVFPAASRALAAAQSHAGSGGPA